MTLKKATQILEQHQEWRRGAEIPMTHPIVLGDAIDKALSYIKNDELYNWVNTELKLDGYEHKTILKKIKELKK